METQSVEQQILTRLVNYLTASELIKTFADFKKEFNKINPILVIDNVYYCTEFREGLLVKKFLIEQKTKFLDKASQLLINNMITHWVEVIEYILIEISDSLAQNTEQE